MISLVPLEQYKPLRKLYTFAGAAAGAAPPVVGLKIHIKSFLAMQHQIKSQ